MNRHELPTTSKTELTRDFILSELKKLQYLYGLNRVIRFNMRRNEKHQTQSVAEHIANLIGLAHYFRKYEDPDNKLDFEKVIKMIYVHDMPEIETGDIVDISKNHNYHVEERSAILKVKAQAPQFVADDIERLHAEYENKSTPEARYVYALDKFEGQLSWMSVSGIAMARLAVKRANQDIKVAHKSLIQRIGKYYADNNFDTLGQYFTVINEVKEELGIFR